VRASPQRAVLRRAAVVAYWAVAVLFVADVAVLQEWLGPPRVAGEQPQTSEPTASPASPAPPAPTTVTLSGGARVTFPGPPTESSQVLLIAGSNAMLRLHSAEGPDGTTYNMGEVEYPPQVNLNDPAQNLLASVSGAAGNVNGRIVERDVTEYQGAPAVDFVVEAADVRLRARHVLDGRRLLAQNVAYRGAEPDDVDDFFGSLVLDGPPATPTPSPTPSPGASPTPTP
jgi:hypothetical protein